VRILAFILSQKKKSSITHGVSSGMFVFMDRCIDVCMAAFGCVSEVSGFLYVLMTSVVVDNDRVCNNVRVVECTYV
jgi:hypothetical protein